MGRTKIIFTDQREVEAYAEQKAYQTINHLIDNEFVKAIDMDSSIVLIKESIKTSITDETYRDNKES